MSSYEEWLASRQAAYADEQPDEPDEPEVVATPVPVAAPTPEPAPEPEPTPVTVPSPVVAPVEAEEPGFSAAEMARSLGMPTDEPEPEPEPEPDVPDRAAQLIAQRKGAATGPPRPRQEAFQDPAVLAAREAEHERKKREGVYAAESELAKIARLTEGPRASAVLDVPATEDRLASLMMSRRRNAFYEDNDRYPTVEEMSVLRDEVAAEASAMVESALSRGLARTYTPGTAREWREHAKGVSRTLNQGWDAFMAPSPIPLPAEYGDVERPERPFGVAAQDRAEVTESAENVGRYAVNLLAGMYAAVAPTTTATRTTSTEVELEAEGKLHHLFRLGTTTPLAAGVKTRGQPGSDEAIEWIAKGGDITEAFPELGALALMPLDYWDLPEEHLTEILTMSPDTQEFGFTPSTLGGAIAVPLILTELDVFSVGMGVAGTGLQLARRSADLRKLDSTADTLERVANDELVESASEALTRISTEADVTTRRAVNNELGFELGLHSDAAAKSDALAAKLPELRAQEKKARERAEKATSAQERAEAKWQADAYEHEATQVEIDILARKEARERIAVEQMEALSDVDPAEALRAARGLEAARERVATTRAAYEKAAGAKVEAPAEVKLPADATKAQKAKAEAQAKAQAETAQAQRQVADLVDAVEEANRAALRAQGALKKAHATRNARRARRTEEMKSITAVPAKKRTPEQAKRLKQLRSAQKRDAADAGALGRRKQEYRAAVTKRDSLARSPQLKALRQRQRAVKVAEDRLQKLQLLAPSGVAKQRLLRTSADLDKLIRRQAQLEKAYEKSARSFVKRTAAERVQGARAVTAADRARVAEYAQDAWRGIASNLATSLRKVRQKVADAPLEAARADEFADVMAPAVVARWSNVPGQRTIDKGALWATLVDRYGESAVRQYIRQGGPGGRAVEAAVDSTGQRVISTLSPTKVAELQAALEPLAKLAKVKALREGGELRGMSVVEAWMRGGLTFSDAVRRTVDDTRWVLKVVDPLLERYGAYGQDVLNVATMTVNNMARFTDELTQIARRNPEHAFDQMRYLDTHHAFEVSDGKSIMNQFDETLWNKARRYLKTSDELREEAAPELEGLALMWLPSRNVSPKAKAFLIKEARENLRTSDTFQEFVAKQQKSTRKSPGAGAAAGPHPGADVDPAYLGGTTRSIDLATQLVGNAAMQDEAAYLMSRAAGGLIDEPTARSVNALLTGQYDEIANYEDALEGLLRLGAPFTQRSVRSLDEAQATAKTLVARSKLKTGETVFTPEPLVRHFDQQTSGLIKELDAFYARPTLGPAHKVAGGLAEGLRLWRTDVVLGLGLPQPKYWMNNAVGDFSQLWVHEGLRTATRLSFQNLPTNIPLFGKFTHDRMLRMADWAEGKPILGDVINAVFNPRLNKIWQGESGHFVTRNGQVITNDQVRKWMPEDGILDTFIRGELQDAYFRATSGAPWARASGAQHWINEWAAFTQQRQRGALYLDLLEKGATRQEAKRRTLRALYDWENGLTQWELRTVARFIPFYRFWGLAMRSGIRMSLEGLTRPATTMARGIFGQTEFARFRQQGLILNNLHDFRGENRAKVEDEYDEYRALAGYLRPGYLKDFPAWSTREMSIAERQWSRDVRHRPHTHVTNTLPKPTYWDVLDIYFGMIRGVAGMMAQGHSRIAGKGYQRLASDWEERFFDPVLSMPYGPLEQSLKGIAGSMGADVGIYSRGGEKGVRLTEGQAGVLRWSGYTEGLVNTDKQTGAPRGPLWVKTLMTMTPVIGTRIPSLADQVYFNNPEWKNGIGRATLRMAQNMSGVMTPRTFSPAVEEGYRTRDVQRSLRSLAPSDKIGPEWAPATPDSGRE